MTNWISTKNIEWPVEQKACDPTKILTAPLCNSHVKVVGYYMAMPYNFMMRDEYWDEVSNSMEVLLAARYCMEIDMNKLGENMIYRAQTHTRYYIYFQEYVRKHIQKEAIALINDIQNDVFSLRATRSLTAYSGFKKAISNAKKVSKLKMVADAKYLIMNNAPLTINRNMYKKVFGKDYDSNTLDFLTKKGVYLGEGREQDLRRIDSELRNGG